MATLEDFRAWYERDLSRYAPWDKAAQVLSTADAPGHREVHIRVFTDKNRYGITVREPEMHVRRVGPHEWADGHGPADGTDTFCGELDNGYLGCIATSRKWRAGEDWHRGSDLSDGPLTEETWRKILADIVGFELVDLARGARNPDAPTVVADRTP